jgi:hypothetical protein
MGQNINNRVSNSGNIINRHSSRLSFISIVAYICDMSKASIQEIIQIKNELIQSMLDLAQTRAWNDISIEEIFENADCNKDIARALYDTKLDIFALYGRSVDLKLAENMDGAFSGDESLKDRLFDIMMERFDILNENRAAVVSILNGMTLDPKKGISAFMRSCESIEMMMNLADIDSYGWKGSARTIALSGIYLKVLRDWVSDDSADMAATMASLDKALGYYFKIKL